MDVQVSLRREGSPSILLDGKPVEHVTTGLRIEADKNGNRTLTLDLLLTEALVDGEAVAEVPEETAQVLVALGWTPPKPKTGKKG